MAHLKGEPNIRIRDIEGVTKMESYSSMTSNNSIIKVKFNKIDAEEYSLIYRVRAFFHKAVEEFKGIDYSIYCTIDTKFKMKNGPIVNVLDLDRSIYEVDSFVLHNPEIYDIELIDTKRTNIIINGLAIQV